MVVDVMNNVLYLGTNEDSIRCLEDMAAGGAGIMQVHCSGMLECLEQDKESLIRKLENSNSMEQAENRKWQNK